MDSMLKEIPPEIHNWLLEEKGAELPRVCIICRDPAFFTGSLDRTNPRQMLIYCLCRDCYEKSASASTVEKIIYFYESIEKADSDFSDQCGDC